MKAYKVVIERDGDLISYVVRHEMQVKYMPGEFVEAPETAQNHGYHLLVFDSLESVNEYYPLACNSEVWEVEAEEEITSLPFRCDAFEVDAGRFVALNDNWPEGTRMFKRVKLLNRVR